MEAFMDENELSQSVALLLQHSAGIIKKYDERYRQTGLKYNIFKIARISEKEVIMCRVIADLLNPKGSHYKGDLYLKSFLDVVSPKKGVVSAKIDSLKKLNTAKAKVITEYSTDAKRRIDIVISDDNVFIPIEAKIWAGEQKDQVKDYAEYSRKKNKSENVPVLFLTLDGKDSETAKKDEYVSISFKEDIVSWLEQCLNKTETEKTPPIHEVIKQLLSAIKSILGETEDNKMNKEITEIISQSKETLLAAAAIKTAVEGLDGKTKEIFSDGIYKAVCEALPNAKWLPNEEGWDSIFIPIRHDDYSLWINYDWKLIQLAIENKKDAHSPEAEKLVDKMSELFGGENEKGASDVWTNYRVRFPGLEGSDDVDYLYDLYLQYAKKGDEVAKRIIEIVNELEKV
jgi:formate dehydrogenase maturation protein FdhE